MFKSLRMELDMYWDEIDTMIQQSEEMRKLADIEAGDGREKRKDDSFNPLQGREYPRGIKTIEDEKFLKFFKIVQEMAYKKGGVFFLDCAEGNGQTINDLYVSDLSGWLIPLCHAACFEEEWIQGDIDDKWNDYIMFLTWKQREDGKITVDFKDI